MRSGLSRNLASGGYCSETPNGIRFRRDSIALSSSVTRMASAIGTSRERPSTKKATIVATATANGQIEPSGEIEVLAGDSVTLVITPNAGYHVADVLVDGEKLAGSAQRRTPRAVLQHGSAVLERRFGQQPAAALADSAPCTAEWLAGAWAV